MLSRKVEKVMKVERQQSTDLSIFSWENYSKKEKKKEKRKKGIEHQTASQSSVKSRSLSEKKGEEQGEAQFKEDDHLIELNDNDDDETKE